MHLAMSWIFKRSPEAKTQHSWAQSTKTEPVRVPLNHSIIYLRVPPHI